MPLSVSCVRHSIGHCRHKWNPARIVNFTPPESRSAGFYSTTRVCKYTSETVVGSDRVPDVENRPFLRVLREDRSAPTDVPGSHPTDQPAVALRRFQGTRRKEIWSDDRLTPPLKYDQLFDMSSITAPRNPGWKEGHYGERKERPGVTSVSLR